MTVSLMVGGSVTDFLALKGGFCSNSPAQMLAFYRFGSRVSDLIVLSLGLSVNHSFLSVSKSVNFVSLFLQ